MPGQGPNPPFIYNNDHRAAWQQGIPQYIDERFAGQQIPAMVPGPPAFQGNPGVQGYRPPNWGPNNYNYQYYNHYAPRANWPRGHHHSNGQGSSRSSGSSRGNGSRNNRNEAEVDMCFICKDLLQNCDQLGVHLCDGGVNCEKKQKGESSCEINARLGMDITNYDCTMLFSSLKKRQSLCNSLFLPDVNVCNSYYLSFLIRLKHLGVQPPSG